MTTLHNISLKPWHTFGIEAQADTLITIDSADEVPAIVEELARQGAKPLVLGGGSNTVFTADCHRPILHMANNAIVLRATHDDGDVIVEADAGVEWDRFVQHCIANGWYGAENLVAIPGTVGAAPVQNVGAYGSEAADIVERVHAVDLATGEPRVFSADECLFGYRSSIFKTQLAGRYIITSVCFRLHTEYRPKLEYKALREALAERGLSHPTAREVADTVTDIRWSKLPRPQETGSAGSFFKNPVVTASQYEELQAQWPGIAAFASGDKYKLSAGWLIEHAGWKGRTLGTAGVYERNALVLCNRGNDGQPCLGNDVLNLAKAVTADVEARFGVLLEPEAIIIQ